MYTLVLPANVKNVAKSSVFDGVSRGPSMQAVADILKKQGVKVESKTMEVRVFTVTITF